MRYIVRFVPWLYVAAAAFVLILGGLNVAILGYTESGGLVAFFTALSNIYWWFGIVIGCFYLGITMIQLAAMELPTVLADWQVARAEKRFLVRAVIVVGCCLLMYLAPTWTYMRLQTQQFDGGFLTAGSMVYYLA